MINRSILLILPAVDFNEQEFSVISSGLVKYNFKVFIASDTTSVCIGKGGQKVKNDISFLNMRESNFAGLIFIGGSGVKNYWDNTRLHKLASNFLCCKKPVGAICSAPVILSRAGLLNGVTASCYAEDRKELERGKAVFTDAPVATAKKIITGNGPAAAHDFLTVFINEINKQ